MTPKGIKMAKDKKKSCFVIAPIGEPDSDVRQWSNKIFNHIIKPAVESDYDPIRADQMDQPGLVTAQIVDQLLNADLTIADLTNGNPNVYYEVAIRHAVKKPIVHLIKSGQTQRFDIQGMRAIPIDNDLEIADKAVISLKKQVKKLEADPNSLTTPVSQAINLAEINKSTDPSTQALADINRQLTDLSNRLQKRVFSVSASDPLGLFPFPSSAKMSEEDVNTFKREMVKHAIMEIVKPSGQYYVSNLIKDFIKKHGLISPTDRQTHAYILGIIGSLIDQGDLKSDVRGRDQTLIVSLP